MKAKVIQKLIKDGYSEGIAVALADKYWEEAERHGYRSAHSIYQFILREWRGK